MGRPTAIGASARAGACDRVMHRLTCTAGPGFTAADANGSEFAMRTVCDAHSHDTHGCNRYTQMLWTVLMEQ